MREYVIYDIGFGSYVLINMQDITIQQAIKDAKNGVYPEGFYRESED